MLLEKVWWCSTGAAPPLMLIRYVAEKYLPMKKVSTQLKWLAVMIIPPNLYVVFEIAKSFQTYDGHCKAILEVGPDCTPLEFVIDELTHPFVLPYVIFVFVVWIVLVGLIYLSIKVAASKKIKKQQHNQALKRTG